MRAGRKTTDCLFQGPVPSRSAGECSNDHQAMKPSEAGWWHGHAGIRVEQDHKFLRLVAQSHRHGLLKSRRRLVLVLVQPQYEGLAGYDRFEIGGRRPERHDAPPSKTYSSEGENAMATGTWSWTQRTNACRSDKLLPAPRFNWRETKTQAGRRADPRVPDIDQDLDRVAGNVWAFVIQSAAQGHVHGLILRQNDYRSLVGRTRPKAGFRIRVPFQSV
jgi:hypothetical protein